MVKNNVLSAEEIFQEYKANVNNGEVVAKLLRMKNAPSELFDAVATKDPLVFFDVDTPKWKNIHYARRSPKLSREVLEYYVEWVTVNPKSIYVLSELFNNPTITGEMLTKMVNSLDYDPSVSKDGSLMLVDNPFDRKDLNKMADLENDIKEQKESMLRYLAHHKNLPADLLELALNSKFDSTRFQGARNPNLTPTQVDRLLRDKSALVRCEVVRNRKVPIESLLKLIEPLSAGEKRLGGEFRVIQTLIRRLPDKADKLRALEYLLSFNKGQGTRVLVAKLSEDKDDIARSAVDASRTVRRTAVRNPKALPEDKVASALMGDSNVNVIMVTRR